MLDTGVHHFGRTLSSSRFIVPLIPAFTIYQLSVIEFCILDLINDFICATMLHYESRLARSSER